jgi:transposase
MAMADGNGLPLAVGIACGQRHEAPLARATIESCFVEELPQRVIGDKAYDSDALDAELDAIGVEMIAPHSRRRNQATQDARKLRRYRRRWKIERLFSWLLRFRRIVTRYEEKAENFLGFLHLACLSIYLRQL